MKKFNEVMKYLINAVRKDYMDSPYKSVDEYWDDMSTYWSNVFKEDCFNELTTEMFGLSFKNSCSINHEEYFSGNISAQKHGYYMKTKKYVVQNVIKY